MTSQEHSPHRTSQIGQLDYPAAYAVRPTSSILLVGGQRFCSQFNQAVAATYLANAGAISHIQVSKPHVAAPALG